MWKLYKWDTLENCLVQNSLLCVQDFLLTWKIMCREVSICHVYIVNMAI